MPNPTHVSQAVALGHQELVDANDKTNADATYGASAPAAGVDCLTQPEGTLCAETACVDGFKILMYCDGSGGCSRYFKVPC